MSEVAVAQTATEPEPLTPDFYRYDWSPLRSAHRDGRFVHLEWPDGVTLVVLDWWLRENAVGAGGVDPQTREGMLDPSLLDENARVATATISDTGALVVGFNDTADGADIQYHPGWLRHVADGRHQPDSWLPTPVSWTTAQLNEPVSSNGAEVLAELTTSNNEGELRHYPNLAQFVRDLLTYGVARLQNTGIEPDLLLTLASAFGPARTTNFGEIWDVRALGLQDGQSLTNSTANTTARLGPHTDLPTRETPPGFQFLHCVQNEAPTGGYSTMTDGLALVDHIRTVHPSDYEALTSLNWIFFNRGRGIDHRWSGPLIDISSPNAPLTLRAFYPVKAFPDMAPEDMPRAYDAMARFYRLAATPEFMMEFPFAPGDVVAFDNRRVLHGRTEYLSQYGRHLRGIYVDHDEVYSFARVQARVAESTQVPPSR